MNDQELPDPHEPAAAQTPPAAAQPQDVTPQQSAPQSPDRSPQAGTFVPSPQPPPQAGTFVPSPQAGSFAPQRSGASDHNPEPSDAPAGQGGFLAGQGSSPYQPMSPYGRTYDAGQQHTASYPPASPGSYPPAPSGLGGIGGSSGAGGPGGPGGPGGQAGSGGPGFHPYADTGFLPAPPYGQSPYGMGQSGAPQPTTGQPGDTSKSARRFGPTLAIVAVAALVGGGVGAGTVAIADRNNGNSVNSGLKITNSTGAPTAQLNGTIGAAAAKIRPSVVTIDVTSGQSEGTGSGVIIRSDGYILTNDHVVSLDGSASGGAIKVTLSDGRTTSAKVVGEDASDDLAVIKVTGLGNLTAATFGKSGSLTVGQSVVAVGAPLGLSDTVTSGIVSNTTRPVRAGNNDQAVFQAIQTDAAINPGNSGGPLVDLNGSVVGINAAIATDQSGGGLQIPGQPQQQSGNIGIGFAIPSDESSRIAGQLIAQGKATHAVIGVSVGGQSQNDPSAGTPTISQITASGPAAKAGLKVGDVITSVAGQQVTTADALIAAIRSHAPGETVPITYTRSGSSKTATLTLGSADS